MTSIREKLSALYAVASKDGAKIVDLLSSPLAHEAETFIEKLMTAYEANPAASFVMLAYSVTAEMEQQAVKDQTS